MKPRNGTWAFNADTHITAWLDAIEQSFDVLTDEDLHLEGPQALAGYRTVITGTHPEYYSTSMRDALAGWMSQGGRLMYMGGNGFYWRIAHHPENPAIIEVRRAEDGTRAWIAQPGEYSHQFTGEYGGLWRRLGRPPNELVGIRVARRPVVLRMHVFVGNVLVHVHRALPLVVEGGVDEAPIPRVELDRQRGAGDGDHAAAQAGGPGCNVAEIIDV